MDFLLTVGLPDAGGRLPAAPGGTPGWSMTRQLGAVSASVRLPRADTAGLVRESDNGLALIAGDPVSRQPGQLANQLERCLSGLRATPDPVFAAPVLKELVGSLRGVFALVLVPRHGAFAVVAGDHLGVRPVYRATRHGCTCLATRLGIIAAALPSLPAPDLLGVLQWAQLDTIYGERTLLEGVSRIRAAEIWVVHGTGLVSRGTSLDWAAPTPVIPGLGLAEAARLVHGAFTEAVRIRGRRDAPEVGFLSGGMDSRLMAHTLLVAGRDLWTFGFAPPGSQDLDLAEQFAAAAGIRHRSVPRIPRRRTDWGGLMRGALDEAVDRGWLPEPPAAVWSGDGGSVGLGGVNLSAELIEAFRSGDARRVAALMTTARGFGPPRYSVSRGRRAEILDAVATEIAREAEALLGLDPARAAHVFLLLHDQRRHLDWYHELMAVHGIEYILPFYDRELHALLATLPTALLLRHQLYTEIFRQIGHPVATVPYQTYPGHLAALSATPPQLGYQWQDPGRGWRTAQERGALLHAGWRALTHPTATRLGIRRRSLALALLLHRLGIRDQTTLLALVHDLQLSERLDVLGGGWSGPLPDRGGAE